MICSCDTSLKLLGFYDLLPSHAFEPPHDKTNKMIMRPAKTQISLGIQSDQSLRCALSG